MPTHSNSTEPSEQEQLQTPPKIAQMKSWIPTSSIDKRPTSKNWQDPQNHDVFIPTHRAGFVHTNIGEAKYIITIDVDVDPTGQKPNSTKEIPQPIRQLLKDRPTYTETSMSGHGQHILYYVDEDTAALLNQLAGRVTLGTVTKGELFHHSGYVIYTLKPSSLSPPNTPINAITRAELVEAIPELSMENALQQAIPQSQSSTGQRDPNENIDDIINRIPDKVHRIPYFDTPKAKRIIDQLSIPISSNYDWWLTIGMALSDLALCTTNEVDAQRCYQAFLIWSEADAAFVNEQDVLRHYKSFGAKPHKDITYRTLISIVNLTNPRWLWFVQKSGKNTTHPDPKEIENVQPLVESTGFKFLFNVVKKTYAVESDDIPRMEVDREGLESKMHDLMATNGMRGVTSPLARTYAKKTALSQEEFNPIEEWISSKPWDNKDRLQALYNTIQISHFDDKFRDLYNAFIYKNLMALVAHNFYEGDHGGTRGIVILQGAQNTYKSTWVKQLLPLHLRDYYCPSMMGNNMRGNLSKDFNLEAGSFAIVNYDEVEGLISGATGSAIKNFLIQSVDSYRPVYGTKVETNKRFSTFWGTTNQSEIKSDSTGMRRFWLIPVEKCDTIAQADIDMQQVFAQIKVEMEATLASRDGSYDMPWDLTKEERLLNVKNMSDKTSASDLDMLVHDIENELDIEFNIHAFTNSGAGPNLKLVKTQRDLVAYYNSMGAETSMANLKHALNRYCGKWTSTIGRKTTFPNVQGYIKDGKWHVQDSRKSSYYLLPHLLKDAESEANLD